MNFTGAVHGRLVRLVALAVPAVSGAARTNAASIVANAVRMSLLL